MRPRRQDGSVLVMVGLWLPVLALFVSFAIDVAHWFDYSRNLQNRADAAALAAGNSYGATCFGTPSQAELDAIGETAQQYAGPPDGTPDPNLPYPLSRMIADGFQPYYNQPNLNKGTPANLHLLLNATQNWPAGGDWSMGTVCSATDEDGVTAPMIDVRITQAHLGLFLPLVNVQPTISAHARVELQAAGEESAIEPIAVRDSNVRCVEANFVDAGSGVPINAAPVQLTNEGQDPSTGATVWDIPGGTPVRIPTGANVYVQVVTNDCGTNSSPTSYDSSSGLLAIDSYPSGGSGSGTPAITTGGVTLTSDGGSPCSPDQYFSTTDCAVDVTAHVVAPAGYSLTAQDTSTGASVPLSNGGSGSVWTSTSPLAVQADTGRHPIEILWTDGSGGSGTLGVQQQAFSACNSDIYANCAAPNDSGPILLAQLSTCDNATPPTCAGGSGADALAAGSTPTLDLTLETATLSNSVPNQPPTILRFSEQGANQTFTSHATGLIDCGQGQSNTAAITTIEQGCPTAGTPACPATSNNAEFDFCAPLAVNERNDVCTPAGNQLGAAFTARTLGDPTVAVDCVETVGGSKSPIPQGIAQRIIVSTANGVNTCASNDWSPSVGASYIDGPEDRNDPRAMTMIITSPADLSKNNGPPVPIHTFATFYVTGWDTQGSMSKYDCGAYTSPPLGVGVYPADAKGVEHMNDLVSNPQQGEVWGYWIKDTNPDAGGNGKACDPAAFGDCTAVLTR